MLIKSSIRTAKIKPESLSEVRNVVSNEHDVAWSSDLDENSHTQSDAERSFLPTVPPLTAMPLEDLADTGSKNKKDLRLAYLNLGMNATSLAGQFFPEVLEQPIEGMEFIVASATAFDAWRDKERTSHVKAGLATGKALLEAVDVLAPYIPGLSQVQPYTKVAGIVLKTAESAYVVYTATEGV